MLRTILIYGVIAGLIVVAPTFLYFLWAKPDMSDHSALLGYTIMLIALSTIFVAVKSYRDKALGGVIKFVPALLMGLGISVVAGVIYVVGWEIYMALTNYTFAAAYGDSMVEAARAKGASPAEVEALAAQMEAFAEQYANPLFRVPVTFIEIFPVGLVVSLISAALLRNSRFLPARANRAP
jgi:hypothetical protein